VVFLSKEKEKEATLPFKHVRRDGTERIFKGTVVKTTPDYTLVKPERVFFIQWIKFAPGKGPRDYINSHRELDNELKKKYGKTRCEMDCHEIVTFLTLGRNDMVVLWDAPNLETYQRIVAASVNPGTDHGTSETHTAVAALAHPGL